MLATRRAQITGTIALCLLVVPLLRLARALLALPPAPMSEVLSPPPRSRTPYEAAWQTARWHWMLSQEAACRQLEVLEPWDPAMAERINVEFWRRQFLARDISGHLRQARKAAMQAQVLARTPRQAYRATLMRLRIERDADHPAAELRQAQRLVALAPQDRNARWLMQAAVRRNRRDRWAVGGDARSARALRSPSEAALREARHFWRRAVLAVKPEVEAWAAEHPDVITDTEAWRQMMARDPSSDLRRGCVAAQLAVARARTPEQIYQAERWLALIECNRGHHQTELQHAQRLVVLQPRNAISWEVLRRAAQCNGLERLARQVDVRLQAYHDAQQKLPVWETETMLRMDRCRLPQ